MKIITTASTSAFRGLTFSIALLGATSSAYAATVLVQDESTTTGSSFAFTSFSDPAASGGITILYQLSVAGVMLRSLLT